MLYKFEPRTYSPSIGREGMARNIIRDLCTQYPDATLVQVGCAILMHSPRPVDTGTIEGVFNVVSVQPTLWDGSMFDCLNYSVSRGVA